MEGSLQTFFFFFHSGILNRTLLKNILTKLSILFMLFWWEKIKIREKILMNCFLFYLNCLNDKENRLKLSIYKKYNFFYTWESGYPLVLKGIHIPTERGLKGESQFFCHLIPWRDLQQNMGIFKYSCENNIIPIIFYYLNCGGVKYGPVT